MYKQVSIWLGGEELFMGVYDSDGRNRTVVLMLMSTKSLDNAKHLWYNDSALSSYMRCIM